MIKVVMDANGIKMTYEIDTMETLAKFQAQLTEEVVKSIKSEISEEDRSRIINEYLEDVQQGVGMYDFVDEIENNMPRVFDELIERALRDTDYDTIDEMTEVMDNMRSALADIYDIVREWS